MRKRHQDDFIRTALRVPPELHAKLHESASKSGRTFNAEILDRLEQTFIGALGGAPDTDALVMKVLMYRGILSDIENKIKVLKAYNPQSIEIELQIETEEEFRKGVLANYNRAREKLHALGTPPKPNS